MEAGEKQCIICKRKGDDLKQLVEDRNSYICPSCLEDFPDKAREVLAKK